MLTVAVPGRVVRTAARLLGMAALAVLTVGVVRFAAVPAALTGPGAAGPVPPPPAAASLDQPLRAVATTQHDIALTFDISWGTVMPPKVVAILEHDKVPATFFLSGPWVAAHADFVRAMAKVPYFQIESHGQAHVNFSGLGQAGVIANIEKANAAILAATGKRPTMIRPPNGDYSKASVAATASLGMRTVIWDTDSLDWMNPGVATIVRRVVGRAHPGDIVLMHASDTCKQTDIALPTILSDLKAKGYRFVTLNTLLASGRPLPHT